MSMMRRTLALLRLGLIHPRLAHLAWKLKRSHHTYLSYAALHSLAKSFMQVKRRRPQAIHVVEFGVGRGGSAMLLAWLVARYGGKLTLFDVFGRIPAPTAIDGERARQRYAGILTEESQDYYGNLPDLLEIVKRELAEVCDLSKITFVQGRYEETLPSSTDPHRFSQVHIDCDWYESSMVVYRYLQGRLLPGAMLQVDDYSDWDGSRRAYHEAEWINQYPATLVDGALVIDTGG